MTKFAVFDTKSYDRDSLGPVAEAERVELKYFNFRLDADSVEVVRDVDGVCVFVHDDLPRDVIEQLAAVGVKMIVLRCAGFNNVDLQAAKDNGITVVRVPAYSPYAVAEYAVMLILAVSRKVARSHNRVRDLNFSLDGLVGFDLHGKTAGIIGTGKIGRITAEILTGFGMRLLVCDPFPDEAWAHEAGVQYVDQDTLAHESDVISLHAPLTSETRHLVNKEFLAKVKTGVVIINTSRGLLVDTKALIKALKNGRVGGVGLDVYEEEEAVFFEDHSSEILLDDKLALLITFPNVLVTAHQAFLTREALHEIANVSITNMRRFGAGEEPLGGTAL